MTLWGDFLAFSGAITVVGYIVAGRILREWMPVFVYAVPVTLLGAILLIPFSIVMGESTSAIGWIESDLLGWFILLAFLAGIVGHTGLNACLRWLRPLTVSFAVTLEPIIGAFIGTEDLGQYILKALSDKNGAGIGLTLGICVAFIGLIFDNLIRTWVEKRKKHLGIA